MLRRKWHDAPDAEEIGISADEVEEALQGVENTSGVCRSMGAFACLAPPAEPGGDPLLVLQGGSYTAGFGKYFSRFLYMLPDDVQEQVRRENAALTDDLLAEICGDAQFNANLHPPLLKWEISYPTGESGAAEEQLRSSDIGVERDPDDPDTLRLVHAPTGRRVVPVDLGFLNPRMRPPLYQLVSRFTPPAMFGPPVPEAPSPAAPPARRRPRSRPRRRERRRSARADAAAVGGRCGRSVATRRAIGRRMPQAARPRRRRRRGGRRSRRQAAAKADGAPEAAAPPPPRILVRPRMTFEGTLVISRQRWQVPGTLFPQREPHESAADFFVRANRWRVEAGIPETSYMRINPLPEPPAAKPGEQPADAAAAAEAASGGQAAAAAGEVPGYEAPAAEQADEPSPTPEPRGRGRARPRAPRARKGQKARRRRSKPRTAGSRDLHKPQFIDFGNPLLVGLLGKMAANLKSSGPVEERLPDREACPADGNESYASEMVVQLYYPAGTAVADHGAGGEGQLQPWPEDTPGSAVHLSSTTPASTRASATAGDGGGAPVRAPLPGAGVDRRLVLHPLQRVRPARAPAPAREDERARGTVWPALQEHVRSIYPEVSWRKARPAALRRGRQRRRRGAVPHHPRGADRVRARDRPLRRRGGRAAGGALFEVRARRPTPCWRDQPHRALVAAGEGAADHGAAGPRVHRRPRGGGRAGGAVQPGVPARRGARGGAARGVAGRVRQRLQQPGRNAGRLRGRGVEPHGRRRALSDALDRYRDGLLEVRGHFRELFDAGKLGRPGAAARLEAAVGHLQQLHPHDEQPPGDHHPGRKLPGVPDQPHPAGARRGAREAAEAGEG